MCVCFVFFSMFFLIRFYGCFRLQMNNNIKMQFFRISVNMVREVKITKMKKMMVILELSAFILRFSLLIFRHFFLFTLDDVDVVYSRSEMFSEPIK